MSNPNSTSGGPPLRALAMVLIALAIVFAGLGAMSLSSSDADTAVAGESVTSSSAPTTTTAAATTTTATTTDTATTTTGAPTTTGASTTTGAPTTTGGADREVPVRVLNNSLVAGLAARTASELGAEGWTIGEVGNYTGGTIAKTTVFYGNSPGEREAAQAVAAELGVTAQPRSAGTADPGPGVTVVVTGN